MGVTVRASPKDDVVIVCDPVGFSTGAPADRQSPLVSAASPWKSSAPWPLPKDSRSNPDRISGP